MKLNTIVLSFLFTITTYQTGYASRTLPFSQWIDNNITIVDNYMGPIAEINSSNEEENEEAAYKSKNPVICLSHPEDEEALVNALN